MGGIGMHHGMDRSTAIGGASAGDDSEVYDTSLLVYAVHSLDRYQVHYLRSILPSRPGKRCCPHFQRTKTCSYGPSCKFDHPLQNSPISTSLSTLLTSLATHDISVFIKQVSNIIESCFSFMTGRIDMGLPEEELLEAIELAMMILFGLTKLTVRFMMDTDSGEEFMTVWDPYSYGRLVIYIDKLMVSCTFSLFVHELPSKYILILTLRGVFNSSFNYICIACSG